MWQTKELHVIVGIPPMPANGSDVHYLRFGNIRKPVDKTIVIAIIT